MTDLDAEVAKQKARLVEATRARIRAEHSRDAAAAQADTARAQLTRDFGVSTPQEALAMHQQLTKELEDAVADLTRLLDEVGV